MGRRFYFDTSIYSLLVGPAGIGKSTALDYGVDMLLEQFPKRSDTTLGTSFTCRALQNKLQELGSGATKTSALLHPDEAKRFFGSYTGEEMVDFLTEVYNKNKDFSYETANNGAVEFPLPYIVFCGNCTIEFIEGVLKQDLLQAGFGRRCLFAYANVKRKVVDFPEETPIQMEGYKECSEWLKQLSKLKGDFTVYPCAKEWFSKWNKESNHLSHGLLQNYYSNKRVLLWKYGMLTSLMKRLDLTIIEEDMIEANNYLTKIEEGMERVFRSLGKNIDLPLYYDILDYLRIEESASLVAIIKRFKHDASASKIRELLKDMALSADIIQEGVGTDLIYRIKE